MTTIARHVGAVSANLESSTRVHEFTALARYLLLAKSGPAEAWHLAEQNRASPRVLAILKSAVQAGGTNDPNWASSLAEFSQAANAFLSTVAPFSAFDAALPDFVKVPFHARVIVTTTAATASLVDEGAAKPVSKLQLANQRLEVRKAVCIAAITNELVKVGDPATLDLIARELRRAVAVTTDGVFFDILTQTSAVYAESSSGMSAAQFSSDLANALDALEYGSDARLFLVLSPEAAKTVAFLRDANGTVYPGLTVNGGTIAGIRVVVSSAVGNNAILFDASQICANSDTITLDASEQATLQLSDAPTDAATNLTSLWQANLRAIRATRYFGVEVLRSSAVAIISGTTE